MATAPAAADTCSTVTATRTLSPAQTGVMNFMFSEWSRLVAPGNRVPITLDTYAASNAPWATLPRKPRSRA
ncbi:MAG: hypothetical protein WC824_11925 [Bacteroidota bacterium]